ncbi:MAG TPA: hypothetical protein VHL53_09225, partial [Acidimicrobiia bacterium]|nr:hypothetical protein [Acidimicrobiia bacterium]
IPDPSFDADRPMAADGGLDVAVDLDGPPIVEAGGPDLRVETAPLPVVGPRPGRADPASQAAWLLGLAHSLMSEGTAEESIVAEVLAEAGGRSRAIEGAYGRAVALLSEFPSDPLVHRTVDLLAKALLRSRRPARSEEA